MYVPGTAAKNPLVVAQEEYGLSLHRHRCISRSGVGGGFWFGSGTYSKSNRHKPLSLISPLDDYSVLSLARRLAESQSSLSQLTTSPSSRKRLFCWLVARSVCPRTNAVSRGNKH